MPRALILLLLAACALRAEDDEVRFRPKAYRAEKTLQNRAYQAPAYPAEKAAPAAAGKRLATSGGGFWSLFRPKPLEQAPRVTPSSAAQAEPFVQRQHITAPTLTPDRKAAADHTPFVEGSKKLAAGDYKAPEKPREKNPLLAPRQGIKEPE